MNLKCDRLEIKENCHADKTDLSSEISLWKHKWLLVAILQFLMSLNSI